MPLELGNIRGEDTSRVDLGTDGGRWLFKDKDLLMGPVDASVIVDKLNRGEINPETPVANEDDGEWHRLKEVSFFNVHVARAQARQRVMRDKAATDASDRRRRTVRAAIISASALALVAVVSAGAWWWVVSHRVTDDWEELGELGITISPPVIALASASAHLSDESTGSYLDVDVPETDAPPSTAPPKTRRRRTTSKGTDDKPGTQTPPAGEAVAGTTSQPPPDADGLATVQSYDMDHITSVLKKKSPSLFPCIKAEVKRSGFAGDIPFEFVVTNSGRVGKLWIDNKMLRGTPMEECFKDQMAKWRFKSFEGERPTVSQSFTVRG